MSKKGRIVLIVTFIILSLGIVTAGLYMTDALPQRVSFAISSFVNRFSAGENVTPVVNPGDYSTPAQPIAPTKNSKLPDRVVGVWLDLDSDVATAADGTYGELSYEAAVYFNDFKNYVINTVYIKPDTDGKFNAFTDAYGNPVDVLRAYLQIADSDSLYKILVADDSLILNDRGEQTFDNVKFYLSNYGFDGVLLASESLNSADSFIGAVQYFSQTAKGLFGEDLQFGVKINTSLATSLPDDKITALLTGDTLDFAQIEAPSSRNASAPFVNVLTRWNTVASYYRNIKFICEHRNDLVLSGPYEWSFASEIIDELQLLWDQEYICGSVFDSAAVLLRNRGSMSLSLSRFLFDGELNNLKVNTVSVNSQANTVDFSGVSAFGHKLLLNGNTVSNGADFNFTRELFPGENNFAFYSCGKTLHYDVYNNTPEKGNREGYTDTASPYVNNNLGTALMVRIKNDDTETLGTHNEKNTYHADNSTLHEGTIDYIKNMELSEAGYIRYELMSGNTVYGVNCELINNGYVLPDNKIVVAGVDDASPTSTDIIFDIDWFIPITVKCKPQSYHFGYDSYSYNISSFTAEYVDVTFFYSSLFYNSALLNFSETSPFGRAELYQQGENTMILRLYLKKTGQFYGFDIFRNEKNQLVISFKKHSDGSLHGKTVMLDPGHGGLYMTGTALTNNTVAEKTVTLSIALKAKDMLESRGANVIMTRTMDTSLTLEERCELLRKYNPDIFVSIHCDGTENIADAGTHTFYFRPYSMPLADSINKSLAAAYKAHIYKPGDTNYPLIDKSIKFYPFYVTRLDQCPSVLVETGFMTNPTEGVILTNDNIQYWLAEGIADGIQNYFANNF